MTHPPALSVRSLSKSFDPRQGPVLQDISFSIAAGECVAVLGRSGAGKSTLARCLTGLLPAASGIIEIDGQLHRPENRLRRRLVQLVWQDGLAALSPFLSIAASLREPLDSFHIGPPSLRAARVGELLHSVGLDLACLDRRPHQISGGEAQRIGIARALAASPRVLILDEPLSALDPPTQAGILPLLTAASHGASRAVLLISHDLTAVRQLADRVLFFDGGRIVAVQPVEDFFSRPSHPAACAFLAQAPPTA